jgi:hypothetical protein
MSDPTGPINNVVRAFRDQPLVLASVLTNVLLIGYLYYAGIVAASERHTEMQLLYDNRKFVGDLLARCTLTEKP